MGQARAAVARKLGSPGVVAGGLFRRDGSLGAGLRPHHDVIVPVRWVSSGTLREVGR